MANTFVLILVILTISTGLVWIVDKVKLAPARHQARKVAQENTDDVLDEKALRAIHPEHFVIENARSLFPVIALVFILRSFLYEPFQIPTGSMMPTLLIGDFIVVNKYAYGVKDPLWQHTLIPISKPQRGDVAVFKYPKDKRVDYIKRVIGVPGDRLVYKNKNLYLIENCPETDCGLYKKVDMNFVMDKTFNDERSKAKGQQEIYSEVIAGRAHQVLINPESADRIANYYQQSDIATARYEWVVPKGHYFMMGDNRDDSEDSRYWGFVPEQNIVGKAAFTWISFEFFRDVNSMLPSWVPSAIRFERIGAIK